MMKKISNHQTVIMSRMIMWKKEMIKKLQIKIKNQIVPQKSWLNLVLQEKRQKKMFNFLQTELIYSKWRKRR